MSGPSLDTWYRGRRQALIAGTLHAAGYVALAYGREPIAHWFYHWTWWTFIVAVDGVVLAKRGDSLLRTRRREAGVLALLSVVFWFQFETWNLRLQDWYYIGADPSALWRAVRYVSAFATVLPGVFEIVDVLEAYGVPGRVRVRPITLNARVWRLSYAIGVAMFVLPLLWPTYAFPLVWGTFVFALDPLNARWGGPSYWQDWARGDITRFCRTLLAGFIAGGLWEAWNFWAPVKWVYTVPFFDELKLFEMPLLGFLGFPPFAVELMCMTTFVTLLRNAPGWGAEPIGPTRGPVVSRRAWRWIIVGCVLFALVQMWLTDQYTVGACRSTLAESLWGQTPAGKALSEAGFEYPADVARGLAFPGSRLRIGQALRWPGDDLEVVAGPILLAAIPEVGPDDAYLLFAMGIVTVEQLAHAAPAWIATGPRQQLPTGAWRNRPPLRRAQVWVRAAQRELARRPAGGHAALSGSAGSAMMPPTHE